ncbi:uncharacterized protein EV420DRAFT_1698732 [Desarmillaria tabescens]|uniref:Uncharacterized protein n=1 Tax=Armillaria tabescens TaxID=1929756 RepID=A0AA39TQB9_ARMTA|nr:uncharacterized protein EV420DRAFT_1698732 [Desarmillaria tabescens]KAK0466812.1 hypothetical protein EV420DRAFT_1698732 [Desarmillaria tabescens]
MTDQCALNANGNLKIKFYHDADDDVPMAGPEAAPKPQISVMYYSTAILTTGTAVYIPVPYRQPSSKSLDGTVMDHPSPVTVPWLYGCILYTVLDSALFAAILVLLFNLPLLASAQFRSLVICDSHLDEPKLPWQWQKPKL